MAVEMLNPPGKIRPTAFSHASRVGDWVFISGQLGWDNEGKIAGIGDVKAQAERAFESIDEILHQAGGSISDVIKITAYLVNPGHFPGFAEVRAKTFPTNPPVSTGVVASSMLLPEALIEIEAFAYLGDKRLVNPSPLGSAAAYSDGVIVGNTMWMGGQVAMDDNGNPQAIGDCPGQLGIIYKNQEKVLKDAGLSFNDLVKINYFYTNPIYYKDLFETREQTFKKNPPGDTVACVRALIDPNLVMETESVAIVPPAKAEYSDPTATHPSYSFSHVVIADGLVYVSAQVPWDTKGNLIGAGDFEAQMAQVYRNVEGCLNSVGCSYGDVAKLTYYITHVGYFQQAMQVRETFVGSNPPAVTGIAIDSINNNPVILCALDAIAVAP